MIVGVFNVAANRAYSAATDKTVKVWDVAMEQVLRSIAVGSEVTDICVVSSLRFHSSQDSVESELFVASSNKNVYAYKLEGGGEALAKTMKRQALTNKHHK